jgi:hypothetical protein
LIEAPSDNEQDEDDELEDDEDADEYEDDAEDEDDHEDEAAAAADPEWEKRKLCPDDACIGVIGPNGMCKVCGRSAA